MTEKSSIKSNNKHKNFLILLFSVSSLIILVSQQKEISESILFALKFSASSIIPSIFPFFIFADFLASIRYNGKLPSVITYIFGVNKNCFPALICGLICGFPSGVKWAVKLHEEGLISKLELENLIGIVNLPSFAFTVCAVGVGMLGSLREGVLLYFITVISSILSAQLFRCKTTKSTNTQVISGQTFFLSKSIKNAGASSLVVTSYIVFFSSVIKILSGFIKNQKLFTLITSFIEIGNSTFIISQSNFLPLEFQYALLGFSLGFSGISVHLQAFSLLPESTSKVTYYKTKLLQGVICAIIFALYKTI